MDHMAQFDRRFSTVRGAVTAATINGLARWTPYVESEIRGLRQLVRPGDVCVDVGAAAGLYTAVLSVLAGPHGRVHSVEPLPFANVHLAQLVRPRQAANVRRHPVALAALPGVDLLHVPVGRHGLVTGRSFLDRSAAGPDPNAEFVDQVAVAVTVDTLDALCVREGIDRLGFVKIDVEGAELQVLEGGRQAIADSRPVVLVEIEARHTARYERTPDEVAAWLLDRGYTMHVWRRGWLPARSIDPGTRNYLFRPRRRERRAAERHRERLDLVPA
ncbi:MAG: FkbM family methyltransferase, partial [Acidimicrobiales bacterium]